MDTNAFMQDVHEPSEFFGTYAATQSSNVSSARLWGLGSANIYPSIAVPSSGSAYSYYSVNFTLSQSESYSLAATVYICSGSWDWGGVTPPSITLTGPSGTIVSWIPPYNSEGLIEPGYALDVPSMGNFLKEGILPAGQYTLTASCGDGFGGGSGGTSTSMNFDFRIVPEPATLSLLMLGAMAALKQRKNSRN
jgi:hypothetical protein